MSSSPSRPRRKTRTSDDGDANKSPKASKKKPTLAERIQRVQASAARLKSIRGGASKKSVLTSSSSSKKKTKSGEADVVEESSPSPPTATRRRGSSKHVETATAMDDTYVESTTEVTELVQTRRAEEQARQRARVAKLRKERLKRHKSKHHMMTMKKKKQADQLREEKAQLAELKRQQDEARLNWRAELHARVQEGKLSARAARELAAQKLAEMVARHRRALLEMQSRVDSSPKRMHKYMQSGRSKSRTSIKRSDSTSSTTSTTSTTSASGRRPSGRGRRASGRGRGGKRPSTSGKKRPSAVAKAKAQARPVEKPKGVAPRLARSESSTRLDGAAAGGFESMKRPKLSVAERRARAKAFRQQQEAELEQLRERAHVMAGKRDKEAQHRRKYLLAVAAKNKVHPQDRIEGMINANEPVCLHVPKRYGNAVFDVHSESTHMGTQHLSHGAAGHNAELYFTLQVTEPFDIRQYGEQTIQVKAGEEDVMEPMPVVLAPESELWPFDKYSVVDASTNKPIPIEVRVEKLDPLFLDCAGDDVTRKVAVLGQVEQGVFSLKPEVPDGTYRLQIDSEGFETHIVEVVSFRNLRQSVKVGGTITMLRDISDDLEVHAVLRWGARPEDLDVYCSDLNSEAYVNYAITTAPNMHVDVDAMQGFGPETVTLRIEDGARFRVFAHNSSGELHFGLSEATVLIRWRDASDSFGSKHRRIFVPQDVDDDEQRWWNVCDLTREDGDLVVTEYNVLQGDKP